MSALIDTRLCRFGLQSMESETDRMSNNGLLEIITQ